jgi:four helix bundle protein
VTGEVARTTYALRVRVAETSSFRDLKVWQAAMMLVEEIYRASAVFPRDERFGLTAQIRRAAVSIPSNIGEGKRRRRDRAFLYHLDIALGSQAEVEVQLEIAKRVGFLKAADHRRLDALTAEVGRMLNGLITSLNRNGAPRH